MPHGPQAYRTDDLDLPVNPIIAVMPPEPCQEQLAADQDGATYLYSHGLRWPEEHPDDPERTGRPVVGH